MKIDTRKAVVRPMTHADKSAVLEIDRAVSGKERAGDIEAKFFRATEDKEQLLNFPCGRTRRSGYRVRHG